MKLHTTRIMEVLSEVPGRYVLHDDGRYRLKEADGADFIVIDRGKRFLVEPDPEQIDDLERQGYLIREGSRLVLPG